MFYLDARIPSNTGPTVVVGMLVWMLLPTIVTAMAMPSTSSTSAAAATSPIKLQVPHPVRSPTETLQDLAQECQELGIADWDVYGDFEKTAAESFLRRFEQEVALEFQKEDAVFMPSGVMAQSIALFIHSKDKIEKGVTPKFVCHATSHLLLHEQNAFRELCGLQACPMPKTAPGLGLGAPPLSYDDVHECFEDNDGSHIVSTVLLELPHRELGGKITPWEDILATQQLCRERGVAFHCDGARIFEATTGYEKTPAELVAPFDSVYISFYKGLGGISGAILMGNQEFCEQARIWLRRFGGNLYSLLPYVVSGWSGYRRYWIRPQQSSHPEILSFQDKKNKLVRLGEAFSSNPAISKVMTLEPLVPHVNMVHCYLRSNLDKSEKIRDRIQEELGVSIFNRLRAIEAADPAFAEGYRCKFELSIGQANGCIPDQVWIRAWDRFGSEASCDTELKDENS